MPTRTRCEKTNPVLCFLIVMAGLSSMIGCHSGPFVELSYWDPSIRADWKADEKIAPSFHRQVEELQALRSSASSMSEAQQAEKLAVLLPLLNSKEHPMLRAEVARTLGEFTSPGALQGLRQAVRDEDEAVRAIACKGWGKRRDEEAVQVLAKVVGSDTEFDVRIEAARQLGNFSNSQLALDTLGRALDEKDPAMQLAVTKSLTKLTGRPYGNQVSAWREFFQGKEPQVEQPPRLSFGRQLIGQGWLY